MWTASDYIYIYCDASLFQRISEYYSTGTAIGLGLIRLRDHIKKKMANRIYKPYYMLPKASLHANRQINVVK